MQLAELFLNVNKVQTKVLANVLDCVPHLWGDDSVRGSRVDEFHRIKVRLVWIETTVVGSKPRSGKSRTNFVDGVNQIWLQFAFQYGFPCKPK